MNMYYCPDCKRIFSNDSKCSYCNGENVKALTVNTPVNVLGNKIKGKVLGAKGDMIRVLIKGAGNEKMIREYKAEQLNKVL